ncbi:MAG: hypothetical protein K2J32_04655 [Ruminococcus sp.]|nr:hypothetical protein [Ruminococcus sp.]
MRLIDADEFINTTKMGTMLATMCTTNVAKKEILKATFELIKERIGNAPTIDAKPVKHGEWTPDKVNEPTKLFYCSECKGLIELSHYAYKCYYNYCPTCGAEMDGVVTRR